MKAMKERKKHSGKGMEKGDTMTVELAVHDLEKGLTELRELMERLRRVVWRSRLKSVHSVESQRVKQQSAALRLVIEEEALPRN